MTTIVVKKERVGCKIFPLKRQKNTDQGELVPPGRSSPYNGVKSKNKKST